MKDYPKMTGLKEGLVIGAGAGPWPFLNRNAEMMPNFFVKEDGSVLQVPFLFGFYLKYEIKRPPGDAHRKNSRRGRFFLDDQAAKGGNEVRRGNGITQDISPGILFSGTCSSHPASQVLS